MADQNPDLIDFVPAGPAALPDAPETSAVRGSAEHAAPETLPAAGRERLPEGKRAELPFTRLAHYEIVSRLRSSALGDTYLGYERSLVRHVELTVLRPELSADPFFVKQFRTEFGAVACLNHPNLLPIYLIIEDQGTVFYVTQHVAGETLANLMVQAVPPQLDNCLSIMEQVLSAAAAAERRGLLDCEIRAEQILLQPDSNPTHVLDIGLADAVGRELCRLREGGTAPAVDPATAAHHRTLRRSLHSLEVLLRQVLLSRGTDDVFEPTMPAPPYHMDRSRKEWAAVPGFQSIAQVADRMAALSPGECYATVEESYQAFCAARNEFLRRNFLPIKDSLTIPGDFPSESTFRPERVAAQPERVTRPPDRSDWTTLRIGILCLGGALLAFSLMGGWGDSDPTIALRGGHSPGTAGWLASAYRSWSVGGVWSDPGPVLFVTRITTQPEWEIPSNQIDDGAMGVSREFNLLTQSDGAGAFVTWDTSTRSVRTRLSPPALGPGPRLCSPDGRFVAAVTAAKRGQDAPQIQVWDVERTSEPVAAKSLTGQVTPLAFARESTALVAWVAERSRQRIVCWDITTWQELGSSAGRGLLTGPCAVHPLGLQAACASPAAGMVLHDLSTGTSRIVSQVLARNVESLAFHPRLPILAIGTVDGEISFCNTEQEQVLAEYSTGSGPVRALTFDRCGRRLASASDENVRVWDLSLDYVRLLIGAKGIRDLVFDSTGRELVTGGPRRSTQIWNTDFEVFEVNFPAWVNILEASPAGIDRRQLETILPHPPASDVRRAETADGRLAVCAPPDAIPYVEDATTRARLGELSGAPPGLCAAVSPSGRFAATGTYDRDRHAGLIQIWDLETRQELRRMWTDTRHVHTLAYTPDGSCLLSGGDRKVHVWCATTGQELCRFPFPRRTDGSFLVSPDSRLCVASSVDHVNDSSQWCVLYDLVAETEVLRYPGAPPELAFTPRDILCDQRFGRARRPVVPTSTESPATTAVSTRSTPEAARAP